MSALGAAEQLCLGCMRPKGGGEICPRCGYRLDPNRNPLALPYREVVDQKFLIGRILGKPGGFGVTYLAWDLVLQTAVAVKEYLPRDLASRAADRSSVILQSAGDRELYEYGLDQFLQEARTLAQISHPNVVRVRELFQQNNSAYLVMDYCEGLSLDEYTRQRGGKLSEQAALDIIMPVLDGLAEVHRKGFLHRDIKPANIYVTRDGVPILLDFGAARFAVGQNSQTLSVILTSGFAPIEQYISKTTHGPWIDIYACGATLYAITTGFVPQDAFQRYQRDELQAPAQILPTLTPQFSRTVMAALAMKPEQRPQSAEALQGMLRASNAPPPASVALHRKETPEPAPATTTVRCPHCRAVSVLKPGQSFALQSCRSCGRRFGDKQPDRARLLDWKVAALLLAIGGIGWIAAHRGQERAPLAAQTVTQAGDVDRPSGAPATLLSQPTPEPQPRAALPSEGGVSQTEPVTPPSLLNSVADAPPAPEVRARQLPPPAPDFAIAACAGKASGSSCSANNGSIQGECRQVRASLACIPSNSAPGPAPGDTRQAGSFRPPFPPPNGPRPGFSGFRPRHRSGGDLLR